MRFSSLTALFVICVFSFTTTAQQKSDDRPYRFMNSDTPLDCEVAEVVMETVTANLKGFYKDAGILIAVARLGEGEKSHELSRRRLYNVRAYLKDHGIPPERIVVAEGEAIKGFGRIEFYLSGKLVETALLKQDRDFCIICCDIYGPYYPQKENSDREAKKPARKR
jgi:hypothetical protein